MMLEEFYRTRMHNKQIIGQLEMQVRIVNNNSKQIIYTTKFINYYSQLPSQSLSLNSKTTLYILEWVNNKENQMQNRIMNKNWWSFEGDNQPCQLYLSLTKIALLSTEEAMHKS